MELDRRDEALVVLQPTLDSAEAFLSPGHLLSIVRFRYAIAAVMDDRPRAIAQARRALDELNGIQDSALDEFRHEIKAWLAVQ